MSFHAGKLVLNSDAILIYRNNCASIQATALMMRPSLSNISPIWFSLTISGGRERERVAGGAEHQVVLVEAALHRS